MKAQRQESVETTWRDCFDYTFPIRGSGLHGSKDTADSGQSKQAELLDNTAGDSCQILSANIMAGLTPANSLWFALDSGNETDEERRWLDDAAKLVWENIHMSNFDAEAFECCLDMTPAGQFALYIDEDRDRGGYAFQQWSLSTVYVSSTRADGRIDIVHREYQLTAEQAVSEFGEANVPERVRKCVADGKPDEEFTFVHAIYPRETGGRDGRMARAMPVASCHIEVQSRMEVRESGYHEMPVVVPRWTRAPGSHYGIGPMYIALPTARELNYMHGLAKSAGDIAVTGMWLGVDDGVLNPRTVKLGPRKIIIAADKDSLTPLQTGANFELSELVIARMQAMIRKIMMADQLVPQDGPQMTATEVHVRVEMIRKLLGPIYGRLQAEYLGPLVDRCFGIAYRAGIFRPAPESLRGRRLAVRYVSPMARSQKLEEVMAVESVVASAAQLESIVPGALDNIDAQEALRLIIEGRGAPQSIRRKPEDVARIQAQKQEQQKQQAAQMGAIQAQTAGMEQAAVQAATS
jgi:hypothetical protein